MAGMAKLPMGIENFREIHQICSTASHAIPVSSLLKPLWNLAPARKLHLSVIPILIFFHLLPVCLQISKSFINLILLCTPRPQPR